MVVAYIYKRGLLEDGKRIETGENGWLGLRGNKG